MLYRYVDILTGDRMIVGISISVRLATGFGGFMPSHSLAPVMIPQIWVVTMCACNAPNPGVPLTTRQPLEFLWISGDPIPQCCILFIGIHIFTKIR